jgi:SAM-dependent methyltransferase
MEQRKESQTIIEQWNTYADLYNRNMGKNGDKFHREIIDPALLEVIGDADGAAVLDAGCGNGYLTHSILDLGATNVIGIDGAANLIQIASTNFSNPNIQFQPADLTHTWPLEDGTIDIIVANMVLQYISDLVVFAQEAKRVLKPQGAIAFSIDHPSHMLFMHALKLAGLSNTKFQKDLPYFETAYCLKKSLWDQAIIGYYHRTLEDYTSSFFKVGFSLAVLKELGRITDIGPISEIIPRVVILKFRKYSIV